MMIRYDETINAISIHDVERLIRVIYNLDKEDSCRITGVILHYFDVMRDLGIDGYEDLMEDISKDLNNEVIARIRDLNILNDVDVMMLAGTIYRLSDWFIYTDKELQYKSRIPLVIDNSIKIYKNYENKYDLYKQFDINKSNILSFIDNSEYHDRFLEIYMSAKVALREILRECKNNFEKEMLENNNKVLLRPLHKRSAPFFTYSDSLMDTVFFYCSTTGILETSYSNYEMIKLENNYDYVNFNLIKNKGFGLRDVYYTNAYLNSYVNSIYKTILPSLKKIEYIGAYDQEYSITRAINIFNKLSSEGKKFSVLSLDVSKYSDTLPIALLGEVLDCIVSKSKYPDIHNTILNILNLPVNYKGSIIDHNVSSQGIPLDFPLITLANIFIQFAISHVLEKKILFMSCTGDDVILFLEGDDYKTYTEVGRKIYALFGMKVNEHKALSCNQEEGVFSYLKYKALVKDGKLINISGISPWLLLKGVISYNRIISILRYFDKINYQVDEERLVIEYCNLFKEDISQYYRYLKLKESDIPKNPIETILKISKDFGGFKRLNECNIEELLSLLLTMKDLYGNIFHIDRSVYGQYRRLCELENIDMDKTFLGDQFIKYCHNEFGDDHRDMYVIKNLLLSDIITSKEDLVEQIKAIIRKFGGKMFQEYVSGDLTTNRRTPTHFEDGFLVMNNMFENYLIPFPEFLTPSNIEDKGIYDLAKAISHEIVKPVTVNEKDPHKGFRLIGLDYIFKEKGIKNVRYSNGFHTSLYNLPKYFSNNYNEVMNSLIRRNPKNREVIISIASSPGFKERMIDILEGYVNNVENVSSLIEETVNKEIDRRVNDIGRRLQQRLIARRDR